LVNYNLILAGVIGNTPTNLERFLVIGLQYPGTYFRGGLLAISIGMIMSVIPLIVIVLFMENYDLIQPDRNSVATNVFKENVDKDSKYWRASAAMSSVYNPYNNARATMDSAMEV
jgi:uncharacterized membrane protein